jgi:sugar/nucleoside kinase (ribokinase family)
MEELNWLPAKPARQPRIGTIGVAGWDRIIVIDRYPSPGEQSNVLSEHEEPGGTTANAAVAIARLGGAVSIRAQIGDDEPGRRTRAALEAAGIEVAWLTTVNGHATNTAIVLASQHPSDRTFLWKQGATLSRGDRVDISALFAHDVVYIDVYDMPLRRLLLDLPAHTLPATRLFGSLTSITRNLPPDAFDLLMRHDAVVGDANELVSITGSSDLDDAIGRVRTRMLSENLRAVVVSLSAAGSLVFTIDQVWRAPAFRAPAVDATGAGDAFAGAVAFGMACRWDWGVTIRFANAVAACAVTKIGAQSALPTWDEAIDVMRSSDTI